MFDGFYSIFFTGLHGEGFGVLAMKNGVMTGADASGATYDGHYQLNSDESTINGEITLHTPTGVELVTALHQVPNRERGLFLLPCHLTLETVSRY